MSTFYHVEYQAEDDTWHAGRAQPEEMDQIAAEAHMAVIQETDPALVLRVVPISPGD